MLRLTFSSKLDWGSYVISIAKTASKKIGALTRSMKFISPEVALCLYKSTIRPCVRILLSRLGWCPQLLHGNARQATKNEFAGLLVLHLLLLLNPWLTVEMWPTKVFSIGIALVDNFQNWLNWFHFLFLAGGLLVVW